MTMARVLELIEQAGFPPGVVNLVHGGKDAVDALLDHPEVRAISFVGSTPVARYVYGRAAANGKRAQCQGGAKNPIVILPDADMEMTTQIVADSAFGCAGQRCLASSVVITVGDASRAVHAADQRRGRDRERSATASTRASRWARSSPPRAGTRIEGLIAQGVADGAKPLVDGRSATRRRLRARQLPPADGADRRRSGQRAGAHRGLRPGAERHARGLGRRGDRASSTARRTATWRACSRRSGAAARQFRYEARAGNVGINVGVAAPMAYFPFSGWKDSFFGDLHAQGRDAIDFYTEKKIVVERWPATWSRKF